MSDKTKAAMPGRQWYTSKRIESDISTVIGLVNLSRCAGAGNYGRSQQHFTEGGIPPPVRNQTFGKTKSFIAFLICDLIASHCRSKPSYVAWSSAYCLFMPYSESRRTAASKLLLSLLLGAYTPRVFPVSKAIRCRHRTSRLPASHVHVMTIFPESSETVTAYISIPLLLVAKKSYFIPKFLIEIIHFQLFGVMPCLRSFSLHASFTHELKLPRPAAESIFSSNPSSKRMFFIVLPERSNLCLELFSCIGRYRGCKLYPDGTYHHFQKQLKTAKPGSVSPLTGPLTTNDIQVSRQL